MAETPTPVKPAVPVAVDIDAAADESVGVVSTEPTPAPIIPPSGEATPTSVEDLFRAGEEERAAQEAAAAQPTAETPAQEEQAAEQPAAEAAKPAEQPKPAEPAKPAEAAQVSTPAAAAPEKPAETPTDDNTLSDIVDGDDAADEEDEDIPTDLKINAILFGKIDEALAEIRKTYTTAKEFDKAQDDPTSILSKYMTTALHGWPTGKRNFLLDVLKKRNKPIESEKELEGLKRQEDAGIPAIVDGRPKTMHKHGANLSGKEASMVLQNCLGGLHRVCLLNSGFWVLLRAPGMDELNELFNTIDAEGKELGRSLGAHFALISDMYIKKRFLDLLIKKRIIMESNFEGIYEKDEFEKVLSFHDYDALMHGILSICTRKGLRMQMYCPKCHNESQETNMDISACKFIDRSLLTDGMITHWNKKRDSKGGRIMHNRDDLRKYREMLPVKTQTITQVIENKFAEIRVEMDLETPNFARYFRVGGKLLTALTQTMNNIAKGNEDKSDLIKDSLEIHGYQLIAPWVKTLRVYPSKDATEPELVTEDTDVILDYLDGIAKTRMTYIGTFSLECPFCHARPETDGINFYPIDVHTVFFGLCFRLLRRG